MGTEVKAPSNQVRTMVHAHSAATTALTPLLINGMLLIPLNDRDANADNSYVYKAHPVLLAKTTGIAWTVGDPLYWDDGASEVTNTDNAGANKQIGHAYADQASADDEGLVAFDALLAK